MRNFTKNLKIINRKFVYLLSRQTQFTSSFVKSTLGPRYPRELWSQLMMKSTVSSKPYITGNFSNCYKTF